MKNMDKAIEYFVSSPSRTPFSSPSVNGKVVESQQVEVGAHFSSWKSENIRRRAFPRLPPIIESERVSLELEVESKSAVLTIQVSGEVEEDSHGEDNAIHLANELPFDALAVLLVFETSHRGGIS